MPIRVAIYEDHPAFRESLSLLFRGFDRYQLVGAFDNCLQVEEQVAALQPDIILMDIDMPGRSGIEGALLAKQVSSMAEILMLTVFEDDEKVFQALRAGATGYLLKKSLPTKILEAVDELYNGGAPMTPSIARKVLNTFPAKTGGPSDLDKLTPRERDVLQCLADGKSYKMVADQLVVHIETVRTHIKHIYEKLHVHSVSEAVAKYYKR